MVSAVHRSEQERPPRLTVDSTARKYGCAPGATSSVEKRADRSPTPLSSGCSNGVQPSGRHHWGHSLNRNLGSRHIWPKAMREIALIAVPGPARHSALVPSEGGQRLRL